MSGRVSEFWRDESGAVIIEMTATIVTFLLILFGVVEFSYLFYQWNAATKAVQHGARVAAVSDPVAGTLLTLTGLSSTVLPGDPMPSFGPYVCQASNAAGSSGGCSNGGGTYNAGALQRIVYGAIGNTACVNPAPNARAVGMCNYFDRIEADNVVVTYRYTGLGYAGRPGGAVPTIEVKLTGLTFNFVALNTLADLAAIPLPDFHTTVTGEDLRKSGS